MKIIIKNGKERRKVVINKIKTEKKTEKEEKKNRNEMKNKDEKEG